MNLQSGIIFVGILGCSTAIPGCGERSTPVAKTADGASSFAQTAERGAVRMTITVDKREITLVERFNLTVEVVAAPGIDVEMPRFGEHESDFSIRDLREYPAASFEGGRRWRQEYRLDAFLAGEHEIPEMTARFTDRRVGEAAPVEAEVTVNEFTVTVRSQVAAELDPAAFRDIKGPVPLPLHRSLAWVIGGGLVTLVGSTLVLIWTHRLRSQEAPKAAISPHAWAIGRLQKLVDDQLVERALVREFYCRLSMIVRGYIERRFGATALKRTTEEFMQEAQDASKLPVDCREAVGSLLKGCDMVKFALQAPHTDETNVALSTARDFVDQSAASESHRTTAL